MAENEPVVDCECPNCGTFYAKMKDLSFDEIGLECYGCGQYWTEEIDSEYEA